MEIIMVFMFLTSRHLGMDKREDAGEVEEECVRPQEGRIEISCHYLMGFPPRLHFNKTYHFF